MFGSGPMGRPPSDELRKKMRTPPPKSFGDVPRYLKELIGGFFYRLFYIFRLVWETKPWILILMLLMSVMSGVLPIIGALIGKELINSLVDAAGGKLSGGFSVVVRLLIYQFAYLFAVRLISTVNGIITRIAGELVTNHIRVKIMKKAQDIDLADFDRPEFYERLENANREAGNRPIQILNSSFSFFSTVISMVSFVVVLAAVSRWASVLIIVLSIPSGVVNFIYRRKNVMYMRHRSKDRRQMDYFSGLTVNKDMVKEIRVLDMGDTLLNKFLDVFKRYFAGLKKLIYGEGAWTTGLTIVNTSVNCALFLWIAYKVFNGELSVGDYSLYTGALNSIASGVASIISTTASIYEGTLFIENMITFMKEKKTIVSLLAKPERLTRHIGHKIEFENVSFAYPGSERLVLKNISFTLNPGESSVLVGLNGAGKTTLLKLLTRLYDPTEGRILLDGVDIRNFDVKEYYELFGIIFQDFGKYAVTVRENIAYGDVRRPVVQREVENAAEQSNAKGFIEKLPDTYATPLMKFFEPNGVELSIGQWQKLAIARAFYGNSDILILDEPTASLDAIAEQEIFNQFDALRKGKTTIFVSHRLSSATTASKIIVLKDGQIVEQGRHAELMRAGGEYCRLFTTQASRYISGEEIIAK